MKRLIKNYIWVIGKHRWIDGGEGKVGKERSDEKIIPGRIEIDGWWRAAVTKEKET